MLDSLICVCACVCVCLCMGVGVCGEEGSQTMPTSTFHTLQTTKSCRWKEPGNSDTGNKAKIHNIAHSTCNAYTMCKSKHICILAVCVCLVPYTQW